MTTYAVLGLLAWLNSIVLWFTSSLWIALSAHFALNFFCSWVLAKRSVFPKSTLWNLSFLATLLPIFGPLILLISMYYSNKDRSASFLESYKEYLRFSLHSDSSELLRREREIRTELRTREPWTALIGVSESKQEKLRLIGQIVQSPPEKAAPILNILRSDPENEIAVAASTKFFELEAVFVEKIKLSRELCTKDPGHPEVWNQLSRSIMDYVDAGFCDTTARMEMWSEAEQALAQSLLLDAQQKDVLLEQGRLYLQKGLIHDAYKSLEQALGLVPDDQQIMGWLAEAWFQIGDYSKVRDLLALIPENPGPLGQWRQFWQDGR